MSIIRIQKRESPYVQIDKRPLERDDLSFKAKGLLAYLLSRPDDWTVRLTQLETVSTDGASSVRSAIKELREKGYCQVKLIREKDESGKYLLSGSEYIIYEMPIFPTPDSSDTQKIRLPEIPASGKSKTTNKEITNKDSTNKETNTNKYSLREKTDWFIDFWNKLYDTNVRFTENKQRQVAQRLKVFDANEIVQAMKNRSNDTWLENNGYMKDWNSFWRNNEKVERYLNKQTDNLPF